MDYFKNKKVWITGASSGIGKALSQALAVEEDVTLILTARSEDALNELAQECQSKGAKTVVLPLDLTNEDGINAVDQSLCDSVDIIVNCAGFTQRSLVMDTQNSVNRELMEINYFAPIALTKKVLPSMCKRKSGHVIVISSVAGKIGTPLRSGYAGAKHAVQGYFDSLRAEMFKNNVAVTIIFPGYINTDISKNALVGDGSHYEKVDDAIQNGLPVDVCAQQIIASIAAQKEEVIVSELREKIGVLIKRFFPSVMSRMVRNLDGIK